MITTTNLDYLIEPVRFEFGDITEPYTYSDTVYKTALVSAIKYLAQRWNDKYAIDSNDDVVPLLDQTDEAPVIFQAALILHQIRLSSSATSFYSFSTDDLAYSNIASSRVQSDLYRDTKQKLDDWFSKSLGRPIKAFLPNA
jgi:hypothetical protein